MQISTPISVFSEAVQKSLKSYVYRLIDPRDGSTFYVGKGKGNRVFAHIKDKLVQDDGLRNNEDEDDIGLKLTTIRDIINAGLEVIHVIHRHGMSDGVALEVEAALIDVYPGLTNSIGGLGSRDRGPMNAQQIQAVYSANKIKSFDGYECVIIKIRQSNLNNNNNNVYETVRAAWKIRPNELIKLKNASKHYVLAVVNGIVKGVYNNVEWKPSPSIPGRYEFKAEVVPRDQQPIVWQDCQIPGQYRVPGLARPVIITW